MVGDRAGACLDDDGSRAQIKLHLRVQNVREVMHLSDQCRSNANTMKNEHMGCVRMCMLRFCARTITIDISGVYRI
eukprot:SAG11_NODE_5074_length_1672_cov_1.787031_1_plen_76_part_00